MNATIRELEARAPSDALCRNALAEIDRLREAVLDLTRICEAVRFTAGLGKGQMERVERAKALTRRDT